MLESPDLPEVGRCFGSRGRSPSHVRLLRWFPERVLTSHNPRLFHSLARLFCQEVNWRLKKVNRRLTPPALDLLHWKHNQFV